MRVRVRVERKKKKKRREYLREEAAARDEN